MRKRTKKPYSVCYKVKDRFGCLSKGKVEFDTFSKAQKFALKVSKVENSTGGGSAQLISWGRNK